MSTRGWLLALLLLPGCPDPQQQFNSFAKRVDSLDLYSPPVDMAMSSMVYDVSGQFLLAVATNLAPDMPVQLIAATKLTLNPDGTAALDLSLQQLSMQNRTAVGAPIVKNGVAVDQSGTFVIDLGMQTVLAAANFTGVDVTATLVLSGAIRSPDRFCGDVTGMVTMPIPNDLKGSTWSAIRIPPGTIGNALPAPELKCPIGMPDMGADVDAAPRDQGIMSTDGGVG